MRILRLKSRLCLASTKNRDGILICCGGIGLGSLRRHGEWPNLASSGDETVCVVLLMFRIVLIRFFWNLNSLVQHALTCCSHLCIVASVKARSAYAPSSTEDLLQRLPENSAPFSDYKRSSSLRGRHCAHKSISESQDAIIASAASIH